MRDGRSEDLCGRLSLTRLATALLAAIVVLFAATTARADPHAAQVAVSRARELGLDKAPAWHRLLLYKSRNLGRYGSQVDGADFFLAAHGKKDPAAELEATVESFFLPQVPGQEDKHALCKFPARRIWLDSQLHFLGERPGIDYFANTSTMEYQIERGGESVGLGTYDQHAMKVLYGRVIETLDEHSIPLVDQPNFGLKNYTQLQERDLVVNGNRFFAHYTQTARLMKVFDAARDCRDATEEEKATSGWRVVHGKVCAPPPKDHWTFDDFKSDLHPAGIAPVKWHAKVDGKDKVRWNYRWGEQYGAGGYMHTTMMDAGADVYELTQNLTRSFDLRYPWSYFRRGDREWNAAFLAQSVASNYFGRLRAYHWQIALDIARAQAGDLASDDGIRPYVMAQADIFAFMQPAALMPEPGDYKASTPLTTGARSVFDLVPSGQGPAKAGFSLGITDARYIADDFENDKGGSGDYLKYVHHAGFEEEKSLAMMQLVDPRPTLFTVAREKLLAKAFVVKKDAVNGKPMVDDRGQWVLDVDATGKPIPTTSPDAQLKLRRYVGLMDAVRQIAHALDGPLGGAGGGAGE